MKATATVHSICRYGVITNLPFFELAFVFVRLDNVASFIVNADHSIILIRREPA